MAYLYLSTDSDWKEDALLLLAEEVGNIGDKTINRFHICSGWIHRYWKARADLAACIAVTLNARIFMRGFWVKESLEPICTGERLPDFLDHLRLDKKRGRLKSSNPWHPDNWIFDPEDLLFTGASSFSFLWNDDETKKNGTGNP